jgi:hypothetical protein
MYDDGDDMYAPSLHRKSGGNKNEREIFVICCVFPLFVYQDASVKVRTICCKE